MPGQIPVMAENRKKVAGIYSSQCTVSKPVNQMPAHNIMPTNRKKAFIEAAILSTKTSPEKQYQFNDNSIDNKRFQQQEGFYLNICCHQRWRFFGGLSALSSSTGCRRDSIQPGNGGLSLKPQVTPRLFGSKILIYSGTCLSST